ncbi:hypothetical protein [Verrucomicrobium sp. 3C]|uniref:hypothetical protein n=1 Tax=Verrucomicrobium sp. 3C TaxID=1134055 RepID=UPI00036B5CC4|nr:hypothetical protein [Verrucomicrobium sp. 3C]
MSPSSAVLLLRVDRFDPESGLFASFPRPPRVPLLRFAPLPTGGRQILEAIGALDENAARLLPNFRRRFPKIYEALESIGSGLPSGEEKSLFFFLSVCCIALQVEEGDIRDAASVSSGLQIDYALIQEKEQWFLDTRPTLRSLWSYKLADVPNAVLPFSLFESLGQTLGAFAGRCGELLDKQTLRLSGDLADHPILHAGLLRGLPRKFAIEEEAPASSTSSPDELNASGPRPADSDPASPPAAPVTGERGPSRAEG